MSVTINAKGTSVASFAIGKNKLTLDASNLTTSRTWIFPDSNGSSGQVLTTNGSGVLSWTTNGSGTVSSVTVAGTSGRITSSGSPITSSGTITLDLDTVSDSGTGSFLKLTRDSYGRVSGTTAVVASDITTLVDSAYVDVIGDTMSGALLFSQAGTAISTPDNGSGVGTKLTVMAGTGTGQASSTGGNGHIEIIGPGSTTSWTSFTSINGRRRGGILLKAGLAAGNSGATYSNGSRIDIIGANGTNDGTNYGDGSQISIVAGIGNGGGFGGALAVGGGAATGNGGETSLNSGNGKHSSGNTAGFSQLTLGAGQSAGTGGSVTLSGGSAAFSSNGAGGGITLTAGLGDGSGDGGSISFTAGSPTNGASGNGGAINITAGDVTTSASVGGSVVIAAGKNNTSSNTGGGGSVLFKTAAVGATSLTERMRITPAGKVGIGQTPTTYALEVNGDVQATNFRGDLVGNASTATTLQTARTINGTSFNGSANVAEQYACVQYTQSSGTNGGTTTTGNNTVPLNTLTYSSISGLGLSSNVITSVPAGTYRFTARQMTAATGGAGGLFQLVVHDNTNNASLFVCDSVITIAGGRGGPGVISGSGVFTLSGTIDITVIFWVSAGLATTGFGSATSSGNGEVYSTFEIWRIA